MSQRSTPSDSSFPRQLPRARLNIKKILNVPNVPCPNQPATISISIVRSNSHVSTFSKVPKQPTGIHKPTKISSMSRMSHVPTNQPSFPSQQQIQIHMPRMSHVSKQTDTVPVKQQQQTPSMSQMSHISKQANTVSGVSTRQTYLLNKSDKQPIMSRMSRSEQTQLFKHRTHKTKLSRMSPMSQAGNYIHSPQLFAPLP